jgi:hypothetical protein
MTEKREYTQQKLWKSMVIWLINKSGWKIGGVTKEGSRRSGDFDDQSDIKIDFWITEPYQKQKVFDDLMPKLRNVYRGSQVLIDSSQNVIQFVYNGLKIGLNILPKMEFKKKAKKNKI